MRRPTGADGTWFEEHLLPARPRYVSLARALLRVTAAHARFTEAQTFDVCVAMSEAYTNVIIHANTPWITLRYAVQPRGLTVEVEDDGEGSIPPWSTGRTARRRESAAACTSSTR